MACAAVITACADAAAAGLGGGLIEFLFSGGTQSAAPNAKPTHRMPMPCGMRPIRTRVDDDGAGLFLAAQITITRAPTGTRP
jgi:hypothetical protein